MANAVSIRLAVEGGQVVSSAIDGVKTRLEALKGAIAGIATVGGAVALIRMADAVTTLNTQLNLATGSAAKASQAYDSLFQIAQKTRVSFAELGTTYAAIARAGNEMGVSQARLLSVTQSISQAMTIGGGSAQSMQAALVQLSQGLSSGVLRGEELNSIMEQTPRLAKALADGLGVPIGELRKLGAAGALTAQQVIGALEKAGPQLAKEMASATLTVGQAYTMLGNSTTKLVGDMDKATGASTTMAGAIKALSGALDTTGKIIKENQTAFAFITGGLAAAATVAGVYALGAGFVALAGSIKLAGLALLASPVGIAVAALAAVSGGVYAASKAASGSVVGLNVELRELERTNALAAANPSDKILAANTQKRTQRIQELREQLRQLKSDGITGGVGSGDVALMRAQMAQQGMDAKALGALRDKLSGIPNGYRENMQEIIRLNQAGLLVGKEYTDALAQQQNSILKTSKGAAAGVSEASKGLALYNDLTAKSTGLNADFAEKWALLNVALKANKINVGELTQAQAVLLADQPAMQAALREQADTQTALAKASEEHAKAREQEVQHYADAAIAANKKAQELEDEIATYGLGEEALKKLTIARLRDEQAKQMSFGDTRAVQAIEDQIKATMRLAQAKDVIDGMKEFERAAEKTKAEWRRTADAIEGSITDALMRGFESGKGFAGNLRDTVVNMFKTMVLRPVVEMGVRGGLSALGLGGAAGLAGAAETVGGVGNALNGASMLSSIGPWMTSFGTSATQALYKAGEAAYQLGFEKLGGSVMDGISSAGNFSKIANGLDTVGNGLGYLSAAMAASEGKWGQAAGSGIGTFFGGPIGAAIGGAIGGWVDNAFGGGKEYTTGTGLSGTFSGGNFAGQNYQNWRNDGSSGFFGIGASGSSSGTNRSAMDATLQSALGTSFAAMQIQTAAFATSLGLSADRIKNFSAGINVAMGADAQANQKAIADALDGVANQMAAAVLPAGEALAKAGETTVNTLARLATSLTTVNALNTLLRQRLISVSVAGADAASKLADAFGGLGNLATASKAYYDAFYTDSEKAADSLRNMTSALASVNLTLPTSKEAFRAVADSLDKNTESGRTAYATLLTLAPEFAAAAEAASVAAKAMAKGILDQFTGMRVEIAPLNTSALIASVNNVGTAFNAVDSGKAVGNVNAVDTAFNGIDFSGFTTGLRQINVVMGDANSGVITFGRAVADMHSASLSPTQSAVAALSGQIRTLQEAAGNTAIEFTGLSTALASVNTETFMAVLDGVFANLGNRFKSLQDSITDQRVAVREAAIQIIDPKTYSRAQIAEEIAQSAEGLPSPAGLDSAAANYSAATTRVATAQATQSEAAQAQSQAMSAYYAAQQWQANLISTVKTQVDAFHTLANKYALYVNSSSTGEQLQYAQTAYAFNEATNRIADWAQNTVSSTRTEYKNIFGMVLRSSTSGSDRAGFNADPQQAALLAELVPANSRLSASEAGINHKYQGYVQSVNYLNGKNTELGQAHAAKTAAEYAAKQATIAYANSVKSYAVQTDLATTKLGKLREETVKYFEQQKALSELMTNSAGALKKTVADYRYSQLAPEQQFAQLQDQFSIAHARALSTSYATKAEYADKINALLPSLLELANQTGRSNLIENYLAQSDAVAKALADAAPQNYQAESLALLDSIDLTLEALGSGTQLLVDAINAGKNSTVGGLRAVVAALTGQAIPAFAAGGSYLGGLALVGERGPELINFDQPGQIYTAAQTRGMLNGGGNAELAAELRAVRAELSALRAENRAGQAAIAGNTGRLAKIADREEIEGKLVRTDSDNPLATVAA